MNVLIVSYGTWSNNSGLQIQGLAGALRRKGHAVRIAVPKVEEDDRVALVEENGVVHYKDFLKGKYPFPDGRPADVVHAWTPREIVREYTDRYVDAHPGVPLAVHVEDNEELLLERYLGREISSLERDAKGELDAALFPPGLIHPDRYREMLAGADGVSVIFRTLRDLAAVPDEAVELLPVFDVQAFDWDPPGAAEREAMNIPDSGKVVVYSGNDHFANGGDIRLLYSAVHQLNRSGTKVTLVRAGNTQPEIYEGLGFDRGEFEVPLGFVAREKVIRLLGLADVLIQPGISDEFNRFRLPAKIPEFLGAGKPVIIPKSNIGADLVDGENALIAQEGTPEEIVGHFNRLVADPELAARVAAGARRFAENKFAPSAVADCAEALYTRCVERSRHRPQVVQPPTQGEEEPDGRGRISRFFDRLRGK